MRSGRRGAPRCGKRGERGERAFAEGDRIQVAIRPEKLELTEEKPNGGTTTVQGMLKDSAYLGERSHFYVKLDGLEKPVAVSTQNRVDAISANGEARPIWLSWDPEAVVLLGAD